MYTFFFDIYKHAPIFMQNMVITIFGFLINRRRYGSKYKEIYEHFLKNNKESTLNLRQNQKQKISQHLINALNSKYWRNRFREFNVDVYGDPYIEIKKLPILTKKEVQENVKNIQISILTTKTSIAHSSGTTGSGLSFPITNEFLSAQWAVWWRYRNQYGLNRTTWSGLFSGRRIIATETTAPPFYRINYIAKQVCFSAYHLSADTINDYVSALEEKKLPWLHGYPSFLAEIASLSINKGLILKNKPNVITIGAESLTENQKRSITSFFGISPKQHYGLSEGVANFSQIGDTDRLAVDEDFAYTEFIKENNHYRVVGTNFCNQSFPLFRYDTGDITSYVDESSFPRELRHVLGRIEDSIILPNGRKIGRLDHIFKKAIFLDESQIVQTSTKELIVKVVKNKLWDEKSEDKLIQEFEKRVGRDMKISFIYVEKLPRTSSGKIKFVISEI